MKKVIVDVRQPAEYLMGHVEGALNIPVMQFMHETPDELKHVHKDTRIILYCNSGSRSDLAKRWLTEYGFTNVTNGTDQKTVEAGL